MGVRRMPTPHYYEHLPFFAGQTDLTGELVGRMYRSRIGTYLMLGAVVLPSYYVHAHIQEKGSDPAAIAVVVTAFLRILIAEAYAKFGNVNQPWRTQVLWQSLYAIASLSFSIALTLLAVLVILYDDIRAAGWIVSIVIGYCYGCIPYVAVRPLIGVPQLSIPIVGMTGAILLIDFELRFYLALSLLLALASVLLHLGHQNQFAMTLIRNRQTIERLAKTDPLTGLWNTKSIREMLTLATSEPQIVASYLLIDLDGFKSVNDRHGHRIGDDVLRLAAERIWHVCGPDAFVARIGGDEFGVLLPVEEDAAAEVCERLRLTLCLPFNVEEKLIKIGASVGVTSVVGHAITNDVIDRADQDMYAMKSRRMATI